MFKKLFGSIAIFIAVFIVISVIADAYYHRKLSRSDDGRKGWLCRCDFRVFWTAGYTMKRFAFGKAPVSAGNPAYEKDLKDFIGSDETAVYNTQEKFYHFRYSPFVALLMVPVSLFAYPADAMIVWYILLNIAMLAALVLLTRQMRSDFGVGNALSNIMLWCIFILSLKFYLLNLALGQSDVIMTLLFVIFLMAYLRGRELLCGAILALVLHFKPSFCPVILYFFIAGKWRLAVSTLVSFAAFLFLPALLIGMGKTTALLNDWIGILKMSVVSQLLNDKNQSITYFIASNILKIGPASPPLFIDKLFFILGAGFTLVSYVSLFVFRKSSGTSPEEKAFKYLEVSLLLIVTLLFSPLVWTSHFITLIIPVAATTLFIWRSPGSVPVYIAMALFVILSVVAGTDLVNFGHAFDKLRFINVALGVVFLTYAMLASYLGGTVSKVAINH